MLTYSYTERNQPQRIKIRATPTFLVCLSPRVKCTQHPVWCRSHTFMLCSLYPVYLGCISTPSTAAVSCALSISPLSYVILDSLHRCVFLRSVIIVSFFFTSAVSLVMGSSISWNLLVRFWSVSSLFVSWSCSVCISR